MNRIPSRGLAALCILLVLPLPFTVTVASAQTSHSAGQWDSETLSLFKAIPIQDGGRVKPLDTYASFTLLRLNGKRTFKTEDGQRLSAIEWFLDCLFYPEAVKDYACFHVLDSEVITAVGGQAHEKKRDSYSYNELAPLRNTIFQQARQYSGMDDSERTPKQRLILNLAYNMSDFVRVTQFFDFARQHVHISSNETVSKFFPGEEDASLSTIVAKGQAIREALVQLREKGETPETQADFDAFRQVLKVVDVAGTSGDVLSLFPPADSGIEEWRAPKGFAALAFNPDEQVSEGELAALAAFEKLPSQVDNKLAFKQDLATFHDLVVSQAKARGEYSKVPIEVAFYRGKYFFYAQWLFVLSFVVVAFSWLVPRRRLLDTAAVALVLVPWLLLCTGITYRCIIRSRPPVTTLYETILFVVATAVIVALFIEYANRKRIGIAIASSLGTFGMFLANKYELNDKTDTMPSMAAVLDTNFWLSTHVTTIIIGYAAGLLAAALAHVFVVGKAFNIKKDDKEFYRTLTRMVYGIVAFELIFSFIGTVLGGIWANYSWGRFWGWDPKENGALLIVLWTLATLHARKGGYIKDMGLHLAAIFLGIIVAFSWWGVNLLGVGLHSYGFTAGIWRTLLIFWGVETAVILLGFGILYRDAIQKEAKEEAG